MVLKCFTAQYFGRRIEGSGIVEYSFRPHVLSRLFNVIDIYIYIYIMPFAKDL